MPRAVERHGQTIYLATEEELQALVSPVIVDARDPEVIAAEAPDGGFKLASSIAVQWNTPGGDTTAEGFAAKMAAAGCLPADKAQAIVTHCGGGGKGKKAMDALTALGYTNVHNGGNADLIRGAGLE
ncbi:hypothetical protein T492DRAFT_928766 [Pavlovales sp. CCMP2436]|nr:hypothetical protein T492DRAFT_928766 [Pavlovales sp. CCMP2436]